MKNLDRYNKDIDKLISLGQMLLWSMNNHCHPKEMRSQIIAIVGADEAEGFIKALPDFNNTYQRWYSESLSILMFLLPSRVDDFRRLYEKPKTRKSIDYSNYVLEDYLQSLTVTLGSGQKKVGPDAAIAQFQQQVSIVKAVKARLESSLFEIKQLVQADLFDSELDAARELNVKGFTRGAGAIAGVVLEKHLAQVCDNHTIKVSKKNPTINDLNQLLKDNNTIDVPDWRFIQRLADLRNICDHSKTVEPTKDDISELIGGVDKITKTIF